LATDSAAPLDTFTVVLPDSVDLPRQLFETLVRLDCTAKLQPGLAASWLADSTGLRWTFTLRDGARFADGSELNAHSVVSSWRSRWPALQKLGLASMEAVGDRRLVVTVRDLRDSLPHLFADPMLSVTPPGESPANLSGRVAVPLGPNRPVLEVRVSPNGDLRDALDGGADLVVTRDPAAVEYAAQRPEFEIFTLPWSRTYLLVQRPGAMPVEGASYDESFRRSLAQDAVRVDARPAQIRSWWNGPCSMETLMEVTVPTASRVAYAQGDEAARQLAERIIALAPDSAPLTAVGLDPTQFARARYYGEDRAYIVAVPLRPLSPCRESADLTNRERVMPLIDTRARAIVRRGSPPLTVDWDGTVRVVPDNSSDEAHP
jgi:hypothetical protein